MSDGNHNTPTQVIGTPLPILERSESRSERLKRMLEEGEQSGFKDYSHAALIAELDEECIEPGP